jgi:siroheme synthase-like protein
MGNTHATLAPEAVPRPTLYPAFLKLAGRAVLVVGGGPMALSKLSGLLEAGARVTVVAPAIDARIAALGVRICRRPFRVSDVKGTWLVVACAPPAVNRRVERAAKRLRVFVNTVDDRHHATCFLGGVVRRGGVTLAVSTDGRAPGLAGLLREALDAVLPEKLEAWLELAEAERRQWIAQRTPHAERRPLLLVALNELYRPKAGLG